MEQIAVINPENVNPDELRTYATREAAHAVVLDNDNNVALLHVAKENYYKLPGGGIEEGEDKAAALGRECLEEIGSEIEVVGEIGSIVEYRKMYQLKQTSYCYLAKLKGEKGTPEYTEDEIKNGFEQVWLPYQEGIKAISESSATSVEGRDYIVPRDMIFLKSAKIQD